MTPSAAGEPLTRLRALCAALPETTERLSHGAPTFFVRDKKNFVMYLDNHHGDGRLALWCAAAPGAQAMFVDSDPRHFFIPAYIGHRGWVGARLDLDLPGTRCPTWWTRLTAPWRRVASSIFSTRHEQGRDNAAPEFSVADLTGGDGNRRERPDDVEATQS